MRAKRIRPEPRGRASRAPEMRTGWITAPDFTAMRPMPGAASPRSPSSGALAFGENQHALAFLELADDGLEAAHVRAVLIHRDGVPLRYRASW